MATRTLSVKEEAYERLRALKEEKESFGDVILRITKKPRLLEFAGILTPGEAGEIRREIRGARRRSNERMRRIAERMGRTE